MGTHQIAVVDICYCWVANFAVVVAFGGKAEEVDEKTVVVDSKAFVWLVERQAEKLKIDTDELELKTFKQLHFGAVDS